MLLTQYISNMYHRLSGETGLLATPSLLALEDQDSGFKGHIAVVSLRTDLVTVMDRVQNIGAVDALGISPQGTS